MWMERRLAQIEAGLMIGGSAVAGGVNAAIGTVVFWVSFAVTVACMLPALFVNAVRWLAGHVDELAALEAVPGVYRIFSAHWRGT